MSTAETRMGWLVPACATALAAAYPVAALLPAALPALVATSVLAAGALVLARRRSRSLRLSLAIVGGCLALGLGGTWLLGNDRLLGLGWILAALFLLPLPVVPWLYSRSFTSRAGGRGTANGRLTTDNGERSEP